jgi:hypothetical protein
VVVQKLDIAIHRELRSNRGLCDLCQARKHGVVVGPMAIIRHKGTVLPHCNSVYVTRQKRRGSTAQRSNPIEAVNWFPFTPY